MLFGEINNLLTNNNFQTHHVEFVFLLKEFPWKCSVCPFNISVANEGQQSHANNKRCVTTIEQNMPLFNNFYKVSDYLRLFLPFSNFLQFFNWGHSITTWRIGYRGQSNILDYLRGGGGVEMSMWTFFLLQNYLYKKTLV